MMATANGARALFPDEKLGVIEVGVKADLALFPIDCPSMIPLADAVSAMSYSSAGLRAETVLVNGKVVLRKGEFTGIDLEKLRSDINAAAKRLQII
ncbi:MAG: amidohydrolase family protein [Clostridia bacterium]|nr:amidohydrolase family protein [Clostridia bacterium]